MSERRDAWQGMNWIRQEKRLAIYLRDGCACMWCGEGVEEGAQLTLDHVVAHCNGGSNSESNLVTACKRCNERRGSRSAKKFSEVMAGYVNGGVKAEDILRGIRRNTARVLKPYLQTAKELIAQRGSAFEVLKNRKGA